MSGIVSIDDIDISPLSLDNDAERTSPAETAEPRKSIPHKPAKKKTFVARFLARLGKPQAAPEDLPAIVLEQQAFTKPTTRRFVISERRRYNKSSLYAVSAGM